MWVYVSFISVVCSLNMFVGLGRLLIFVRLVFFRFFREFRRWGFVFIGYGR